MTALAVVDELKINASAKQAWGQVSSHMLSLRVASKARASEKRMPMIPLKGLLYLARSGDPGRAHFFRILLAPQSHSSPASPTAVTCTGNCSFDLAVLGSQVEAAEVPGSGIYR